MSRSTKWATRAVWLTFAAVLAVGCNPLTTIAFLAHRDEKVPAQAPLRPREGDQHDKDRELTVALLCSSGPALPPEFATADRDLADLLGRQLADHAKANKDKLKFVPAHQVEKFKAANPGWRTMHPAAVGRKLGADCVVDVTVAAAAMYDPQSARQLYDGRAEVHVDVYDTRARDGNPRDHYEYSFDHSRFRMREASEMSPAQFRKAMLERIAYELSLKHVEHKPSQGIGDR